MQNLVETRRRRVEHGLGFLVGVRQRVGGTRYGQAGTGVRFCHAGQAGADVSLESENGSCLLGAILERENVAVARHSVFAERTTRVRGAVRLLGLAPMMCLLVALPAAARPAICGSFSRPGCPDNPEAAFQPFWEVLPNRAGWQVLVSPAFLQSWPPPPNGRRSVVRYAFATRLKPGVADGAEMAAA